MTRALPRPITAAWLPLLVAACSSAGGGSTLAGVQPSNLPPNTLTPAAQARADGGRPPYAAADVHFISGMIPHHAQAVLMAGWAPTHGASEPIRLLAERIVVAQRDEIAFMQRWLRDRGEPVPTGEASHDMMPGMAHGAVMPGMLTVEQLTQLDRARGSEFDRLFLRCMILHHEGAVTMVEQLFRAHGAAQDDVVFKFAADVNADQMSEIDRMSTMLEALTSGR